jgi:hypothetical protein
MAQVIATAFLIAIILGVVKIVFDVQMSKLKNMLTHLLK